MVSVWALRTMHHAAPPAELHIGTLCAAQEAARKNNVAEAERLHAEYLEQGGKPMCVCLWSPASCARPRCGPAVTVCKAHGKLDAAQTVPLLIGCQ